MDGPVGDRITGTGGEGCRCKEEREHRACSSRGVEQQLDAAPEEQAGSTAGGCSAETGKAKGGGTGGKLARWDKV